MATLSFSTSAWLESPALPPADTAHTAPGSSRRLSRAELLQQPRRSRQTDLADFAARFVEESPVPFVIQWGAVTSPLAHVLLTEDPDGAWHARVCTDEELAHWLHTLGMYVRARQRQHLRQGQRQEYGSPPISASQSRHLSPPLAC
jgi:hypothetical protein